MNAYLAYITNLSYQELLSLDILTFFNHTEWYEGAILHTYSSVIYIQKSHNLIVKTITYTLYESVTQKALVVFTNSQDSDDSKFLNKKSIEKVLYSTNISTSYTNLVQPVPHDDKESQAVRAILPKNFRIKDQIDDIGMSPNINSLESPQTEKATDKTLSILHLLLIVTLREFLSSHSASSKTSKNSYDKCCICSTT